MAATPSRYLAPLSSCSPPKTALLGLFLAASLRLNGAPATGNKHLGSELTSCSLVASTSHNHYRRHHNPGVARERDADALFFSFFSFFFSPDPRPHHTYREPVQSSLPIASRASPRPRRGAAQAPNSAQRLPASRGAGRPRRRGVTRAPARQLRHHSPPPTISPVPTNHRPITPTNHNVVLRSMTNHQPPTNQPTTNQPTTKQPTDQP